MSRRRRRIKPAPSRTRPATRPKPSRARGPIRLFSMESFTANAAAKRIATAPTHVVQRAPIRCSRLSPAVGGMTGAGSGTAGGGVAGAAASAEFHAGTTSGAGSMTRGDTSAGSGVAIVSGADVGSGAVVASGAGAEGLQGDQQRGKGHDENQEGHSSRSLARPNHAYGPKSPAASAWPARGRAEAASSRGAARRREPTRARGFRRAGRRLDREPRGR